MELSLHDVAAIAEICTLPSEFLLYLRRRTDSGVTSRYYAFDELDLYMLFLGGDLYVDESTETGSDPDRALRTLVPDMCHDLNVWMERDSIPQSEPAPDKPAFNVVPEVGKLVAHLSALGAQGSLRFGADLFALAGEVQQQIVDTIATMTERVNNDFDYHDGVLGFGGVWGKPTLFLAVAHSDYGIEAAAKRLTLYLNAKRYQVGSDRAYGLLFDERTALQHFIFSNNILAEDPDMEALIQEMGLQE